MTEDMKMKMKREYRSPKLRTVQLNGCVFLNGTSSLGLSSEYADPEQEAGAKRRAIFDCIYVEDEDDYDY